jgi:large subunit ribosomal protein L32
LTGGHADYLLAARLLRRPLSSPPAQLTRPPTFMANPKRKTSKRRSANRRAANAFVAPQFATDPTDGSLFRPHRVNPKNGMYRGRQVLNVEV